MDGAEPFAFQRPLRRGFLLGPSSATTSSHSVASLLPIKAISQTGSSAHYSPSAFSTAQVRTSAQVGTPSQPLRSATTAAARKAGDAVLTSTLHRAVHGVLCLAHTHRCRSRGDTPGGLAWHAGSRLTLHHAAARGCVGSGTVHKRASFMRLFVTADRVRPRAASSTSPASARSWLPAFDVDVEMRAWKNVMDINQSVPAGWSLHPSRVVVPAVEWHLALSSASACRKLYRRTTYFVHHKSRCIA